MARHRTVAARRPNSATTTPIPLPGGLGGATGGAGVGLNVLIGNPSNGASETSGYRRSKRFTSTERDANTTDAETATGTTPDQGNGGFTSVDTKDDDGDTLLNDYETRQRS